MAMKGYSTFPKSPSDCLMSYIQDTRWKGLTSLHRFSWCILQSFIRSGKAITAQEKRDEKTYSIKTKWWHYKWIQIACSMPPPLQRKKTLKNLFFSIKTKEGDKYKQWLWFFLTHQNRAEITNTFFKNWNVVKLTQKSTKFFKWLTFSIFLILLLAKSKTVNCSWKEK